MHGHAAPVIDRMARAPDGGLSTWTPVATLGIGAFTIGTDMFVVAGCSAVSPVISVSPPVPPG